MESDQIESGDEQQLDVVIVGAGISGISAACYLEKDCPGKSYRVIEARESVGGTWDLFRYPGIRSDSDMHTFGFKFKPWTRPKAISDGPSILEYLNEAVDEYEVRDNIDFGRRVTSAAWDSASSTWLTTTLDEQGEVVQYRSRLLFMCSGYYRYAEGYTPAIPGLADFTGTVVHPQLWPEDLDYSGKRVAVIGSGATAVTLIPAMADEAAHITMVQRSPTYILSMPGKDRIANLLNSILPANWAYAITRSRNIRFQNYFYKQARKNPGKARDYILTRLRKALKPEIDVDKHFTPNYDPWTQRMCLVPDSDLFNALNSGKADVVTGHIKQVTANGIEMIDGEKVEADIIVTATGIQLEILGGAEFFMDGHKLDFSEHFFYQGMMFSGVPNLIQTFGYINASWTLRADLNSKFVCELLKKMDIADANQCVPVLREHEQNMPERDWVTDFNPGYFKRAMNLFPRQGDHAPWHNTQDYLLDLKLLKNGPSDDGVLMLRQSGAQGPSQLDPEPEVGNKSAEKAA
jgi:cation diffusion facilitator CzcD-associated flavoprotein CzcO